MNTQTIRNNSSSPMVIPVAAVAAVAPKRPIYSPDALLQLALGISPFASASASSSVTSTSNSTSASSSSRVSSNPSPASNNQLLLLSQLQNFPDILAPSAAAATTTNHSAAATTTSSANSSGMMTHIATDGNGYDHLPSGTIRSLFDAWDIHHYHSAEDEDTDEDEEEEEEEDDFVYGESSFGREDLEEEVVERLGRALKSALFGGGRAGGAGRIRAAAAPPVVWQAQTPVTSTPSRAASPVREFALTRVHPATIQTGPNDDNTSNNNSANNNNHNNSATNNIVTRMVTTTTMTMARPVIVRTNSRPSAMNRSRSRSGTTMSRECAASSSSMSLSSSSSAPGVWRSRTLAAAVAAQQQKQQQQSQLEWRRGQQSVRSSGGVSSSTWDAKRTNGAAAAAAAAAARKETDVASWRRIEGGFEWRWNEPLGSYVVVKV